MTASAGLPALQEEQLPDFRQRKAQILRLANESKPVELLGIEETEASRSARRLPQQSLPLVETDGVDTQAGQFGRLPDLERVCHFSSRSVFSRSGMILQTGPFQKAAGGAVPHRE